MKNCEKLDRSLKIFKHQLILNYCKLVAKDNIIAHRDYASNKSEVLTLGSFTVVLVYFNRCIFSDHILVAWCPENFPAENQICLKFRDYGRRFLPTVSLYPNVLYKQKVQSVSSKLQTTSAASYWFLRSKAGFQVRNTFCRI